MRISHSLRLVFIAYPRTGSTSIGRILDPFSDVRGGHKGETTPDQPFYDHITAGELKPIFRARGWDWQTYRRFAVIRNPYDRIVSLYGHRRERDSAWDTRNPLSGNLNSLLVRRLPPSLGFTYYVFTRRSSGGVAADFKTYTCDASGESLLTDVLRFESFPDALLDFMAELGINLPANGIPHLNQSSLKTADRRLYTRLTRRRVAALYAYDIETFGYTFD